MKKIKRTLVGALACMMFMLFSSDVVAQTFVDGAIANTRLDQELPVLKSAYSVLDRNSTSFTANANDIARKYDSVKQLIGSLEAQSTSEDVEELLREVVLDRSVEFVVIDEEMYDESNFGSTELTDLHSYLKGLLTN